MDGPDPATAATRLTAIRAAAGSAGQFVRATGTTTSIYRLARPLGTEAGGVLAAFRRLPGVLSVEPDLWLTPDALPDDPLAGQMWGLLGPADGSPYGIDAAGAWPTTTGAGVTVAVIDTGLLFNHPDLIGQSVPGYDMISSSAIPRDGGGRDPDASDPGDPCQGDPASWHGTHVAGTIAALANNAIGVFGGAPGVKIEPVRALGTCGGYESDIADAVRWAAGGTVPGVPPNPYPARVLNLSLSADASTCPAFFASALADARSHGAVVVVAAGNDAIDAGLATPADCADAVTVAAIDSGGLRASFSNYGAEVDIAGPGVGIWSTIDTGTAGPVSPTYATYSGTSMAAPHVSLTAALIAAAYPGLSPAAIELVLEATTTAVAPDASGFGCPALGCGAGIVNAGRAISALAGPAPIVGQVHPSAGYPDPGALVTVTALAVAGPGIASAERRVDAGPWIAMGAADGAFGGTGESVTATMDAPMAEGNHTICIRATDLAAHVSDGTACTTIVVDAGPPVVTTPMVAPAAAAQGQAIAVSATATDGLEVASAQLRIDGGTWLGVRAADGAFGDPTEALAGTLGEAVTGLSAGYHSCVILSSETVRCWGVNSFGEVGDGTTTDRTTPVDVPGLTDVTAIASGGSHTCALLSDTTVRCWGFNAYGQLGDGTTLDRHQPVVVAGLSGVTAIAAGWNHTCAVRADGTAACWGFNDYGQVGTGSSAADVLTPTPVAGLSGVRSIDPTTFSTCALLLDGTVRCWGYNATGDLGDGTTTDRLAPTRVAGLTGVRALAGLHPCALLADTTVRCWGSNDFGELGDGTTRTRLKPVKVAGLTGVASIAGGANHTCAVLTSGAVRCWGYNLEGEVGDGTAHARSRPVPVVGLPAVSALRAGFFDTCALLADTTVRCWGVNQAGELGEGTLASRLAPVRVPGQGAIAIGSHTVCVRALDSAGSPSSGTACAPFSVSDTTAPIVSAPIQRLGSGTTLGPGTVPVRLSWSGSDFAGGSVRYQLARSTNGGPYRTIALGSPGATSSTRILATGADRYRFRVRAIDAAGNASAWAYGPTFQARLVQDTNDALKYTGGWTGSSAPGASGGHVRTTSNRGATVRVTFTGRSVAWVAARGPSRGSARIYIDGAYARTISLRATTMSSRLIVFARSWTAPGTHTIRIVCAGTRGHGRIDLDSIVVLR